MIIAGVGGRAVEEMIHHAEARELFFDPPDPLLTDDVPRPEHANIGRLSSSEKWLLATFGLLTLALGIAPDILLAPLRLWAS